MAWWIRSSSRRRPARQKTILPAEGHLFELLEPEDVVPEWKRWSPILLGPKAFQHAPGGRRKQDRQAQNHSRGRSHRPADLARHRLRSRRSVNRSVDSRELPLSWRSHPGTVRQAGPIRDAFGPGKAKYRTKQVIQCDPNPALINTSFGERQNLTRTSVRQRIGPKLDVHGARP